MWNGKSQYFLIIIGLTSLRSLLAGGCSIIIGGTKYLEKYGYRCLESKLCLGIYDLIKIIF